MSWYGGTVIRLCMRREYQIVRVGTASPDGYLQLFYVTLSAVYLSLRKASTDDEVIHCSRWEWQGVCRAI